MSEKTQIQMTQFNYDGGAFYMGVPSSEITANLEALNIKDTAENRLLTAVQWAVKKMDKKTKRMNIRDESI